MYTLNASSKLKAVFKEKKIFYQPRLLFGLSVLLLVTYPLLQKQSQDVFRQTPLQLIAILPSFKINYILNLYYLIWIPPILKTTIFILQSFSLRSVFLAISVLAQMGYIMNFFVIYLLRQPKNFSRYIIIFGIRVIYQLHGSKLL